MPATCSCNSRPGRCPGNPPRPWRICTSARRTFRWPTCAATVLVRVLLLFFAHSLDAWANHAVHHRPCTQTRCVRTWSTCVASPSTTTSTMATCSACSTASSRSPGHSLGTRQPHQSDPRHVLRSAPLPGGRKLPSRRRRNELGRRGRPRQPRQLRLWTRPATRWRPAAVAVPTRSLYVAGHALRSQL